MSETNNQSLLPALPTWYRLQHALYSIVGRRFDHLLDGIQHGQLSVTWPDGHTSLHGDKSDDAAENGQITLHNFKPLRQMMAKGENGFAECYLQGDWSSDNLVNLFRLITKNEPQIAALTTGGWLARLRNSMLHNRNHNSLSGSRRNIEFHYDLGNDFYRLWLDESMSYSSALFPGSETNPQTSTDSSATLGAASAELAHDAVNKDLLLDAQYNKLDDVIRYLDPKPGAQILEIGCGWGAMAERLATQGQSQVQGISLSHEQLRYARENNTVTPSAQNPGSTSFVHQDYRQVEGTYDHIVSIEMFEAVGERYWGTYFSKLNSLLNSGGSAVLQVITIAEDRYEEYKASPDFIQRYIFPGGMLPSKTHLKELVDQAGFELVETNWFGHSYATTLRLWREKFEQVSREVQAQGFDDRFMRMWRYYLSYCEVGFLIDRTDVGQLLLVKK